MNWIRLSNSIPKNINDTTLYERLRWPSSLSDTKVFSELSKKRLLEIRAELRTHSLEKSTQYIHSRGGNNVIESIENSRNVSSSITSIASLGRTIFGADSNRCNNFIKVQRIWAKNIALWNSDTDLRDALKCFTNRLDIGCRLRKLGERFLNEWAKGLSMSVCSRMEESLRRVEESVNTDRRALVKALLEHSNICHVISKNLLHLDSYMSYSNRESIIPSSKHVINFLTMVESSFPMIESNQAESEIPLISISDALDRIQKVLELILPNLNFNTSLNDIILGASKYSLIQLELRVGNCELDRRIDVLIGADHAATFDLGSNDILKLGSRIAVVLVPGERLNFGKMGVNLGALLHELGHALHVVLSTGTTYSSEGVIGNPPDGIEIPALILQRAYDYTRRDRTKALHGVSKKVLTRLIDTTRLDIAMYGDRDDRFSLIRKLSESPQSMLIELASHARGYAGTYHAYVLGEIVARAIWMRCQYREPEIGRLFGRPDLIRKAGLEALMSFGCIPMNH